eukprot:scaffold117078_cov67-Attheya_sp.AAC.1
MWMPVYGIHRERPERCPSGSALLPRPQCVLPSLQCQSRVWAAAAYWEKWDWIARREWKWDRAQRGRRERPARSRARGPMPLGRSRVPPWAPPPPRADSWAPPPTANLSPPDSKTDTEHPSTLVPSWS